MSLRRSFIFAAFVFTVASLCLVKVVAAGPPASETGAGATYRRYGLDPTIPPASRVGKTPRSVLSLFDEPGQPALKNHLLSDAERAKLVFAIQTMPPVHRRTLKERLRTLSFLDGMPNTALTSTVNSDEAFKLFDITVNAKILGQSVSEWLTEKERRYFNPAGSPLRVSIDAGTKIDALTFALLHEASHVVDACERVTPPFVAKGRGTQGVTPFVDGVWSELSVPVPAYRDSVRSRIWSSAKGGAVTADQAPAVYASLRHTPFVSVYGARNWLDDFAEFVAVYHLTEVLKQPYRIVVRGGHQEVFVYEPMKSDLVRGRIGQIKRFYEGG